jgi:hypothetical protein
MTRNPDPPPGSAAPAGSAAPGWALTRLIKLHDAMRSDMAVLQRISTAAASGDSATAEAALRELSIRRPGWNLRRFCASFCGFVHEHHSVEDAIVFPMLLEHAGGDQPELAAVVDKLQADHLVLTGYLDEVERALAAGPDDPAARTAAVPAVERLSEHLHAHLAYEETQLAAALNAISRVVSEDQVPASPSAHLT